MKMNELLNKYEQEVEGITGHYGRSWERHNFKNRGWQSGEYDVLISVASGSPSKGIVILDPGKREAWLIYRGKARRKPIFKGEVAF